MKEKSYVYAACLLFLFSSSMDAQGSESTPDNSPNAHTWTYIGIGGALLGTALLIQYDQEIYSEMVSWKTQNKAVHSISPVITDLGDGAFSLGIFAGFAGYGLIWKDEKAVEAGKIGIESFFLTGITVQFLKHLCGRERPSAATRPGGFWHSPFAYFQKEKSRGKGISSFDAFPSGHTTTAFAAATTISDFYPEPWVCYTTYSLASLVAISRVMESTHWLSDCFIGAIIGYYGTKLVEKMNYGQSSVTMIPRVDEQGIGLTFNVKL